MPHHKSFCLSGLKDRKSLVCKKRISKMTGVNMFSFCSNTEFAGKHSTLFFEWMNGVGLVLQSLALNSLSITPTTARPSTKEWPRWASDLETFSLSLFLKRYATDIQLQPYYMGDKDIVY